MFPHLDDSSQFQSSESSWFLLAFVAFQFKYMWHASSWQECTYFTQQVAASQLSSWLSGWSCVVRGHRKLPSMGFLKRQVFTLSLMAQNIPKLPSSLTPTPSYFDPLSIFFIIFLRHPGFLLFSTGALKPYSSFQGCSMPLTPTPNMLSLLHPKAHAIALVYTLDHNSKRLL